MKKDVLYLDNASTTQVFREVVKEMNKYQTEIFGNPSSDHTMGEDARVVIEEAKKVFAKELNCKPWEIILTSCATESNNLAIRGLALAYPNKKRIIISSIEHSSIYEECTYLKSKGYDIVEVPVDKDGRVDLVYLENQIDDFTLLVSIMHVNNEIGTIEDISGIGEICRAKGILFHTDAVQSFGKENIDVSRMKIDLLTASSHKIGGPKGAGFLYIKDGIDIKPIILGGHQEKGLRAGTENVAAIAGFSKALGIYKKLDFEKIKKNRDYFIKELEKLGGKINGSKEKRICNNINVSFRGKDAEMIVFALSERGIMCSTKSACLSKQKKENRVLESIRIDKKDIEGAIRFSINEKIGKKEIDIAIKELKKLII